MRIGWLADRAAAVGGAEFTQAEFRAAAPDGVKIVDCPAGGVVPWLDRYVVHNCVTYTADDLKPMEGKPVIKYWHDIGPWLQEDVREWLDEHATAYVCCSPLQAEHMSLDALCIPPAVDLDRFAEAGSRVNGSRSGAVCVGSWRNYGKAPHKAAEWARGNGGIDFYGDGPFAPPESKAIAYEGMPGLLARYETFVFLPTVIEPFGRVVAEAWAAGCEIVTNGLVGARYWIEENPGAIETAGETFWATVLEA